MEWANDAAVDRAVADAFPLRPGQFSQHDGACAAVAFAAALFGAGESQVLTQQFQQRAVGWYIVQRDKLAPADESDRLRLHGNQYG
jgi:hypothetical protein